jgi:hypothetical protein
MSKFRAFHALLLSSLAAPFLQGASQLDEPTYDEHVYVNCQYRMAAIFPRAPMIKDITFTVAGRSVPARQFYVQQGQDMFSVIVANVPNGPAVDENLVAGAAVPLRQLGEVRFEAMAEYDPGIPGRQLNIFKANGRQHRASVYMADHRLYITESDAAPGDFAALQFEQSVSLINAQGTDLDKNGNLPSRQYNCRK